jgi:hypothetical protein
LQNSLLVLESPQVLSFLSPSHQNSLLALNSLSQQLSPSLLPLPLLIERMMMKQTHLLLCPPLQHRTEAPHSASCDQ